MKAKLWIVALMLTGISACTKDLYTTAPQLVFKSINETRFSFGDPLNISLQVTDKEGDIQDTIFFYQVSYDTLQCASDTFYYQMPAFTPVKDVKATININYLYNSANVLNDFLPCSSLINQLTAQDSCYFKFWIHDNAGHVSDTVRSPDVVFLAQ